MGFDIAKAESPFLKAVWLDRRINARMSAFGPKTPSTETEFFFSAPVCVAAFLTLAFDMISGLATLA